MGRSTDLMTLALLVVSHAACAPTLPPPPTAPSVAAPQKPAPAATAAPASEAPANTSARYIVDGNPVTPESWEALLSTLEGQHDWYCDDMTTGGEEGWKATDPQGRWYQVRMVSDETSSTMEITRLDEDRQPIKR